MANIIIDNQTGENIRVAVFAQNYRQPTLKQWAWQIVTPPQGDSTEVSIPPTFEVFANYPGPNDSKDDPYAGYQTTKITVDQNTGRFIVSSSKTEDGKDVVAEISQTFQDLVPDEFHIVNQAGFGVWGHITKAGADIYPPEVIPPGSVLMEQITSELFLAVVDEYVTEKNRVLEEDVSSSAIPILTGQTAAVTGSKWSGYDITVST